MCLVAGHLRNQDRKLLISQVVSTRTATIGAHEPLVFAVGKRLAERRVRGPACPVPAELEQRDVTRSCLTEVRSEAADNIGPGGVVVLQDLDGECLGADVAIQVFVKEINVVDATIE